jgi:hypothetical protein
MKLTALLMNVPIMQRIRSFVNKIPAGKSCKLVAGFIAP